MREVAPQAIADVDRRARDAAQLLAERDSWNGHFHAAPGRLEPTRRKRKGAAKYFEGKARIAERAAHIQVVARARAASQQRLSLRHFAEDRDADVEGPARGVAADQLAFEFVGQREHATREAFEPGFVDSRHRKREREGKRLCAAGAEIAQVHRERFVAQPPRVDSRKKVPALDQHVGRDGKLHPGTRREQRAIVARAERAAFRGSVKEPLDQVELAHAAIVA
jgi:hypothetical protein